MPLNFRYKRIAFITLDLDRFRNQQARKFWNFLYLGDLADYLSTLTSRDLTRNRNSINKLMIAKAIYQHRTVVFIPWSEVT
jgi:hypothetical protein